ncbi:MAG TPA: hypothetical protein VFQ53_05925 [Kofleriaceae bacterium]|nr:hypothetical protein [Kofleriaceae bacterium]
MVRALLVCVLVLRATVAAADSGKLAEAERAVDEVRYDDARRLLVEAVAAGGNSPSNMRRIYELSASTAIVLGQRELGEQYYRRLLALDPAAQLPAGVAPKVREAFVAAQAYMTAHGRLAISVVRRSPSELEIVVDADPLAMVHAVALDAAPGAPVAPVAIVDRRARIASSTPTRVLVLDDRGNQLAVLDAPAAAAASPEPARDESRIVEPSREARPLVRRWQTWAIPSAACLVAGSVLGVIALDQQRSIDTYIETSEDHFFTEVDGTYRSMKRNATIGIALGGAGVALAVPAIVFYIQSRHPWDLGGFQVLPSKRGLSLSRAF